MTAVERVTPARTALASPNSQILRPQTFADLMQFAQMAAKSSLVPAQFKGKPEDVCLAIQMGSELGLAPLQSLQGIAVINGRPSVWGDALIGLVRADSRCQDIHEGMEGTGDSRMAVCIVTRRGQSAVKTTFSVADAKRAGLWDKAGPWKQYPERMLKMRARGFALRDAFPDVLRGLITAEEAQDTPTQPQRRQQPPAGPVIDAEYAQEPEEVEAAQPPPEPVVQAPKLTLREWMDTQLALVRGCETLDAFHELMNDPGFGQRRVKLAEGNQAQKEVVATIEAAIERRFKELQDGEPALFGEG